MMGFILAAGLGERLRPLTGAIPKPLVPVMNLPAICYSIMLLKEAGISDVIINLHYRPDDVIAYLDLHNNFGLNISFSIEDKILGTGGGVKRCEEELSSGDFVLINSDVILDISLKELLNYHYSKSSPATVVLYKAPDMSDTPPVGIDKERVIDFKNFLHTGSSSGLLYTGLAVLSPALLPHLVRDFSSIVYTGYIEMIRRQSLYFYEHKGIWLDIGSLRSLWNANMLIKGNADHFNKRMRSSCSLELNDISKNISVGAGTKIDDSIIGDNCIIGDGCIIENSVLLPGSRIDARIKIYNSIVYGSNHLLID